MPFRRDHSRIRQRIGRFVVLFDQRGADGLGGAAIDVVLNGLDSFAGVSAVGIFLDEAMAQDKELIERLTEPFCSGRVRLGVQ